MVTIYLAGSIRKDKESWCRYWRQEIEKELANINGVKIINPIKNESLDKEHNANDIYNKDVASVITSDIIFAEMYVDDGYPYIGTCLELQMARYHSNPSSSLGLGRKEIIVWGFVHEGHYFMDAILSDTHRYESFDSALYVLKRKILMAKENKRKEIQRKIDQSVGDMTRSDMYG